MKNVQQYLNELDILQLVDRYICDYPIDYGLPTLSNLTVSRIVGDYRNTILRLVERLRGLAVRNGDGHVGILFAYKCLEDWNTKRSMDFGLAYADEILRDGADSSLYPKMTQQVALDSENLRK